MLSQARMCFPYVIAIENLTWIQPMHAKHSYFLGRAYFSLAEKSFFGASFVLTTKTKSRNISIISALSVLNCRHGNNCIDLSGMYCATWNSCVVRQENSFLKTQSSQEYISHLWGKWGEPSKMLDWSIHSAKEAKICTSLNRQNTNESTASLLPGFTPNEGSQRSILS